MTIQQQQQQQQQQRSIILVLQATILSLVLSQTAAYSLITPTTTTTITTTNNSNRRRMTRIGPPQRTSLEQQIMTIGTTTTITTTTTARHLFAKGQEKEEEEEEEGSALEVRMELEEYSSSPSSSLSVTNDGASIGDGDGTSTGDDDADLYNEIVKQANYVDGIRNEDELTATDGDNDDDTNTNTNSETVVENETTNDSITSQATSTATFRDSTSIRVTNFFSSVSNAINDKIMAANNKNNKEDYQSPATAATAVIDGLGITTNGYYGDANNFRDSSTDTPILTKPIDDGTNDDTVEWDVYIDQSKASKDRGAIATLDSFLALAPPNLVQIHAAMLSKTKGKGPTVRCIRRSPQSSSTPTPHAFEVNNVNDIDKVYLILTTHMSLAISNTARKCLKHTYRGNAHLESNNLPSAIRSYDLALSPTNLHPPQEGVLLLLRSTAYLQRAFFHQTRLRLVVNDLTEAVPDPAALGNLYRLAQAQPTLANPLFRRLVTETTTTMSSSFQKTKYRHGMYEYSLLHAAKDSLRATQLLPDSAQAYLRAAESLAELRKVTESVRYYERAMELDGSLVGRVRPVVRRLVRRGESLERAKAMGWSGDTLRLALDVAG